MTIRLDAHQHFWRYSPEEYGWIGEGMEVLRRDFLPADLEPLLAAEGIDGSIAVQAAHDVAETRWLCALARESNRVKGVVGWADLVDEKVERDLEELTSESTLVGIRHVAQDEPDERFLSREPFVEGVAKLARHDLVYDILVYERQLPAAIELARRLPDQPFVLDHIAKPRIASGELEPWATRIRELATCDNVTCKLSGLVTEADWAAWNAEQFTPYLDVVLEAFGPERLMLGSDWPVCLLAGNYAEVIGLARSALASLSTDEAAAIEGGTAARVYSIAESA